MDIPENLHHKNDAFLAYDHTSSPRATQCACAHPDNPGVLAEARMKLTDYTDYALRVLIHVAVHPDEPVTIQQISEAFGISKNHLVKIVQHLGQVGYLQTTRGRTGGIRLGRAASDINLGEVVRTTEPDFGMVECFRDDNRCIITRPCGLKGILHQALKAYLTVLDGYTLQDLVAKPVAIRRALAVRIPILESLDAR